MNRLFIKTILALAVISVLSASVSFGQKKGFNLPDLSAEELTHYIGHRIKFSKSPSVVERDMAAYVFYTKCGGKETIYTIKSVKGSKKYEVDLQDEDGSIIKIKISHKSMDFECLYDMTSFYSVDDYETEYNKWNGKEIKNSDGQPVAKIIDVDLPIYSTTPSSFTVKSDFDGSTFKEQKEEFVNKICSQYGKILTHPMVKTQYKIVGVKDPGVFGVGTTYNVQNVDDPNEIKTAREYDFKNGIFADDIAWHYHSNLVKVEKPSNPAIRYGKTTVQSENNVSKFSYVDNVIDILIFSGEKEFDFVLKNVSDNSIKVIWNEAVFVGYDGSSSKIMHVGTKYAQRDGDQPPTTIIKGAKIEDCAIPNCNVKLVDSDWKVISMFPFAQKSEPIQLRLMLPIQIKDVINEYVFVFEADWSYDHPERLILK